MVTIVYPAIDAVIPSTIIKQERRSGKRYDIILFEDDH
jgi:hypothetical protein